MAGNMTKAVLRTYLIKETVHERLLDYVCSKAHTVLYVSVGQLCEQTGVDEQTLQEFFEAFGVNTFVAFKYILRKCLYYEVSDAGITKRSLQSVADEAIRMEIRNLTTLADMLDTEMVERLAEDILKASDISIIARAATHPIAHSLSHLLWLMEIPRKLYIENKVLSPEVQESLSPSSLVLAFGRMRYSMQLLMDLKQIRERGCKIVCFTDYPDAPLIPLSDYHFLLPSTSFDFTDSSVAGTTFMHILSLCLAMKREEPFFARMHKRAVTTEKNNMFW